MAKKVAKKVQLSETQLDHIIEVTAKAHILSRKVREKQLETRRTTLRMWLDECVQEEDWHGVMDAAADLREVDAELA